MALPECQGKRNVSPAKAPPQEVILISSTEDCSPRYDAVSAGQCQMNQMQCGFNEENSESSEQLPPLIDDNGNDAYEHVQDKFEAFTKTLNEKATSKIGAAHDLVGTKVANSKRQSKARVQDAVGSQNIQDI